MRAAVIIPAFNAAAFLREAIESVLRQSEPAREIIVVDDGSSDDTLSIASAFGSPVTAVRQENAGVSAARNFGASRVETDWLLFLDADDRLVPEALALFRRRANEKPDCGVIYGEGACFDERTGAAFRRGSASSEGPIPSATRASFWKSAIVTPGAAFIRAEVFKKIGGFAIEWNTAADRDFWIKAGMLTEFAFVDAPVMEKRIHGENMSGNLNRARQQAAQVQLGFLRWCEERGLRPPDDIDAPRILRQNLDRAMETRCFSAAAWLCEEAARRGLAGHDFTRARGVLGWPAPLREFWYRVPRAVRKLVAHG